MDQRPLLNRPQKSGDQAAKLAPPKWVFTSWGVNRWYPLGVVYPFLNVFFFKMCDYLLSKSKIHRVKNQIVLQGFNKTAVTSNLPSAPLPASQKQPLLSLFTFIPPNVFRLLLHFSSLGKIFPPWKKRIYLMFSLHHTPKYGDTHTYTHVHRLNTYIHVYTYIYTHKHHPQSSQQSWLCYTLFGPKLLLFSH